MRRHYDRGKPDGVLQQPHVDEYHHPRVGSHHVGHLVIDVEQRHHAQREQREAHRDAVQVDEHGHGVADQLVPDPYHLYGVGHRLFARAAVKITAVRDPSSAGGCGGGADGSREQRGHHRFSRRGRGRFVAGADHLLAEPLQVAVDLEKLVAERVAQRHKTRLAQAHGHVLQVHEHEEHQHDRFRPVGEQQGQPERVDRQRDGHAQPDVQAAEQRAVPALGHRGRRVHVVRVHRLHVDGHRGAALAQQRGRGRETRAGYRPGVHAPQRGDRHLGAPAVHQAQDERRRHEVEHARRQQRGHSDRGHQPFPEGRARRAVFHDDDAAAAATAAGWNMVCYVYGVQ